MANDESSRTDRTDEAATGPSEGPSTGPAEIGGPSRVECFQVSRVSLVYRYLLLLALTAVGALLLSVLFPMAYKDRDYLIGALLAIWALALLRYWAFLLGMPLRICLDGGESLLFHSLFRTKKIKLSEIAAIRVSPFYQSYLRIVTSRKKTFPMLNHVDGLHDLIDRIKRANPDLETKGC